MGHKTTAQELQVLKDYFSKIIIPEDPIEIKGYATIIDTKGFIFKNLEMADKNLDRPWLKASYLRLKLLKKHFEDQLIPDDLKTCDKSKIKRIN